MRDREYPVGKGWWPMLDEYLSRFAAMGVGWNNIHEKYGILRLDLSKNTDETRMVENEREESSARTCKVCGAPGREATLPSGWVKTLCPECERQKKGE